MVLAVDYIHGKIDLPSQKGGFRGVFRSKGRGGGGGGGGGTPPGSSPVVQVPVQFLF